MTYLHFDREKNGILGFTSMLNTQHETWSAVILRSCVICVLGRGVGVEKECGKGKKQISPFNP